MVRLFAVTLTLMAAAAPAFACDYGKSASTAPQSRTVASQPGDHATTPSSTVSNHKPS